MGNILVKWTIVSKGKLLVLLALTMYVGAVSRVADASKLLCTAGVLYFTLPEPVRPPLPLPLCQVCWLAQAGWSQKACRVRSKGKPSRTQRRQRWLATARVLVSLVLRHAEALPWILDYSIVHSELASS